MKPNQITSPMGPVKLPTFDDRSGITSVMLPSLGKPYTDKEGNYILKDGDIRISPMTVAEEKMLAQKNADPAKKMSILLSRVCDMKGMDPSYLLMADQFFLLIKIRALSYGSVYSFMYKCSDCGHQWKYDLNLETDLTASIAPDDWQEPFEITLPVSGSTVKYRLIRSIDEIELNKAKIKKGMGAMEDTTFVNILARCLISRDDTPFDNPRVTEAWLEKQAVRDRHALTTSMNQNTPGYDPSITIVCPSCGYIHEAEIPMTSDFFRPDVS